MSHSKQDPATAKTVPDDAALGMSDGAGGASLDKVRDILFGVQIRDFERRFARLEERLVKETNDLKEDVRKRLDVLEAWTRAECESLGDRLKAEQESRSDADRDLSHELKELAKTHDKRAAALDEQLAKAQRDARQQMLDQYQRLSDDIRVKVDEVLATLAREAQELRADKADRAVLASLLSEMAMRLSNELNIPGAAELGHG